MASLMMHAVEQATVTAVFALGPPAWQAAGQVLALGRAVPFHGVSSVAELAALIGRQQPPASIALVVHPLYLDEVCTACASWQGEMGVITAATLEGLARRVDRMLSRPFPTTERPATVAVMTMNSHAARQADGSTLVLGRPAATVEGVKEALAAVRPDLFVVDGHSNGNQIYLADGALGTEPLAERPATVLPSEVEAPVVVLNSCGGLRPSSTVQPVTPLGLALLEGPCWAVIATPRVKGANWVESVLITALCRVGCTLGQVVRLVNGALAGSGIDTPGYVLAGDPCWRMTAPADWEGRFGDDPDADERQVLTTGRPVARIPLTAPRLIQLARSRRLLVVAHPEGEAAAADLYYLVAREGRRWYLLLFSWTNLPERLRIRFLDHAQVFAGADDAERLLAATAELEVTGLARPRLRKGPIARMNERALGASRMAADARFNPGVLRTWHKRAGLFAEDLIEAHAELLATNERLLRIPLTDRYEARCQKGRPAPRGACPYCGGTTTEMRLTHWVAPKFRRRAALCARCGLLADQPERPACGVGIERSGQPDGFVVTLHLRNQTKRTVHYAAGGLLLGGDAAGDQKLADTAGVLAPGASAVLRWTPGAGFKTLRLLLLADLTPHYFGVLLGAGAL